jgi:hypothetical protein
MNTRPDCGSRSGADDSIAMRHDRRVVLDREYRRAGVDHPLLMTQPQVFPTGAIKQSVQPRRAVEKTRFPHPERRRTMSASNPVESDAQKAARQAEEQAAREAEVKKQEAEKKAEKKQGGK